MAEPEQANGTAAVRKRSLRWGAALAALIVLLAGGAVVAGRVLQARYDVPTADLFGTPSPTASAGRPSPSPSVLPGAGIKGPLNILIAGIDPRVSEPNWRPNADAVLIMHIPAGLRRAYVFSLPRDLRVDVPAFAKAGFGGTRTKLTHAMSYGSRVPGQHRPNVAQGFQLLSRTVGNYTGIRRFDAGAVLNFGGFTKLVDALGGVDLYVDQRVVSQHRQPDGRHRQPGWGGYVGPQMVYEVGRRHLNGWQALDYARQRYITGGDYARQRHQRQLVRAVVGQILSREVATNPAKLDAVLRAVGDALTFDGRGRKIVDFAFALSKITPSSITTINLPGSSVGRGGGYLGEELQPLAKQFLAAVRGNRVESFLSTHRSLIHTT